MRPLKTERHFLHRDSVLLGIITGFVVPFVGYAVLLTVYEKLDASGFISVEGLSENFRWRTIALLAICINLIPFIYYNKKYCYNTMRGLVFPTLTYVVIWFFKYGINLIG